MVFHRVMELCDPVMGGHGSPLQYSYLEDPHGKRSLVACSLWGLKELNASERLSRADTAVSATSFSSLLIYPRAFPGGSSGKEPAYQCRRQKTVVFHAWVGKIPWRRAWQPTPVFLPGESHGQRSLAGCSPWGR